MSKFPFAYCETTGGLVEPEDVIGLYLSTGILPYLQCPDEHCRVENPDTEITPVCCNPDKPCADLGPHFRTHVKHGHSKNCMYESLREHTNHVLKHKNEYLKHSPDANLLKSLEGIKDTSFLPDVYVTEFKPISEVESIEKEAKKLIHTGKSKQEAYCIARCVVQHTTSKLSTIIDMAEALDKTKERSKVPLSLPGRRKATYENAFLSVYSLKHDYTTPYILCGGVKIHKSVDGFVAVYAKPLQYYHPDYPDISAITPLPADKVKPFLQRDLEHYAETGEICYLYSFSTHCLKESACPHADLNCCVVITPITFGAIVIRERCLNRSPKSNS